MQDTSQQMPVNKGHTAFAPRGKRGGTDIYMLPGRNYTGYSHIHDYHRTTHILTVIYYHIQGAASGFQIQE